MFFRSSVRFLQRSVAILIAISGIASLASQRVYAQDWLQFRGPNGQSAATGKTPESFGGAERANIAWERSTSGRGIGGPLVLDGLVVVTGSGGEDERDLYVEAFAADSGQLVWRRTAHALGRPYTHPTSANASPTPVSDGERIFALYSSCDLICVDRQGALQWYRALAVDYPKTGNDVSMSSSPAVIDGVLLVQLENQGDSYLLAIDAKTGENLWRKERPRRANWASPLAIRLPDERSAFVVQNAENLQIISAVDGGVISEFNLAASTISSAAYAAPRLFVPAAGLTVLDLSKERPEILFENSRLSTRNASHVISGNRLYACKGSVLVAADVTTGEILWQQRVPEIESVWATPVVTATGIYVFDQNGNVTLIRDVQDGEKSKAEIVGTSRVDGAVLASPAVSGDAMFIRAENSLIKVAATK
jgi:outer membrane protein assembly factor BamB